MKIKNLRAGANICLRRTVKSGGLVDNNPIKILTHTLLKMRTGYGLDSEKPTAKKAFI